MHLCIVEYELLGHHHHVLLLVLVELVHLVHGGEYLDLGELGYLV